MTGSASKESRPGPGGVEPPFAGAIRCLRSGRSAEIITKKKALIAVATVIIGYTVLVILKLASDKSTEVAVPEYPDSLEPIGRF